MEKQPRQLVEGSCERRITKFRSGIHSEELDLLVSEEPLEIRLDGHPIAVLMRTPGMDEDLVSGFLVTEGILKSLTQIRKIEMDENRILVFLSDGVRVDLGRLSRNMFAGSSCGICGKGTLDAVFMEFPKLKTQWKPSEKSLMAGPGKLRAAQENFLQTGGLHAAGLFNAKGDLMFVREDIGRHNAVDKVIGRALMEEVCFQETWLLVSGRVSFEIMQKTLAAGIPCVAAISAPSSLAVDFAKESGQALLGFLRPPSFNRYS